MRAPSFRGPHLLWAFVFLHLRSMLSVYLDEFGHIGPFIDRRHSLHNDSPVFGLAGLAIPADSARHFGIGSFKENAGF